MLATGAVVKVPDDGSTRILREMRRNGLGAGLGIPAGVTFVILCALAAQKDINEGDYMAVMPGVMTFFLLPKALAEGWAIVHHTSEVSDG